ncbi:hypothetical protein C8Q73DRAFT_193220 [Cubamyces lactineus]|nr:hypothetical protein C8Q73DRAFT_193220 [Cubamyces lactineus]
MSTSLAQKSITLSPAEPASRNALSPQQAAARVKQPSLSKHAQDGPIMACAANLRHFKTSSRRIYRGLRDCRASFSRLVIPRRSTFEDGWATSADRYKNLLDDADLAASQLMAVIKVYLVLQSSKNEAQEADMITELGNLQQTLTSQTYDLRRRCEKIREDVQASYHRLSETVEMCGMTLAHPANGRDGSSTDSEIGAGASDSTNKPSSRPAASLSFYFWKLVSAIWALMSPESNRGKGPCEGTHEGKDDTREGQGRRQDSTKPAKRSTDTNARQDTQSSQLTLASSTSAILAAIKEVITGLETQAPLFDAFPELAQHLRNEVDAYLRAFEAAKAYPASRKKALEEAQARVVASSKYWKECLAALNGELSATD